VHVRDEEHAFGLLRDFWPDLAPAEARAHARRLAEGFALLVFEDNFETLDGFDDRRHDIEPLVPVRDDVPHGPHDRDGIDPAETYLEFSLVDDEYNGVSADFELAIDGSPSSGSLSDGHQHTYDPVLPAARCRVRLTSVALTTEG
jgi:hypothetical protein